MEREAPPRLYGIPATAAPVIAVLRRGPSAWSHVGRWDLAEGRYEPGAWLAARLFARRCDVSPDGRWLCAFVHKPGASWAHGEAYVALSRLPWLTALHAFGTCGTWSRGYHFTADGSSDDADLARLPIPYGLRSTPPVQLATERRRGWEEAPDCPPRPAGDAWDQQRCVRLRKGRPGRADVLHCETVAAAEAAGDGQAIDGLAVRYALESRHDLVPLDDLQWADWDRQGRLLAATRSGHIQVRDGERCDVVRFEEDLSRLEPEPTAPPARARRW